MRLLCGKPLVAWAIETAKQSKYVDKVVVSTDDSEIAEIGKRFGAEIPFIRPAELATDTATTFSVLEHALIYFNNIGESFDYIILREPTSPLTEPSDIDIALEILDSKRDIADAIVSICKVETTHPVFDVIIDNLGLIRPFITSDFSEAGRRQNISDIYFFEGSLYISDITILLEKKSFYHERTLSYIVPKYKSFEIDDLVDLICVEAILSNINKIKKE